MCVGEVGVKGGLGEGRCGHQCVCVFVCIGVVVTWGGGTEKAS